MAVTFTDVEQAKLFARITAVPHDVASPSGVTAALVPGSATLGTVPDLRVVAFSGEYAFVEWVNFVDGAECYVLLTLTQSYDVQAADAVYVTDFGAVGDGVTDDGPAFAAALAAAESGGTLRVVIPPSPGGAEYILDMSGVPNSGQEALLTVPSGCQVIGSGQAGIVKITGIIGTPAGEDKATFQVPLNATDVRFSNVAFRGENGVGAAGFVAVGQNQSGVINIFGDNPIEDITVEGCTFDNLFGFSIHAWGGPYRVNVLNCTFRYCANGVNTNSHASRNIGNFFLNSEGFEIAADDVIISDNCFVDGIGAAISIGGLTTENHYSRGGVVANNTIQGGVNGIIVTSAQVGTRVIGNGIWQTTHQGIILNVHTAGNFTVRSCTVVGNTVISCGADATSSSSRVGIQLDDEGGHLVVGNTIRDDGLTGYSMSYGISSGGDGSAGANIISSNTILALVADVFLGAGTVVQLDPNNSLLGSALHVQVTPGGTLKAQEFVTPPATPILKSWDDGDDVDGGDPPRFQIDTEGLLKWGDGDGGALDTQFGRVPGGAGAGELRTPGKLLATGGLGLDNITATSFFGNITGKAPIYDPDDGTTVLGYWPITDGTDVAIGGGGGPGTQTIIADGGYSAGFGNISAGASAAARNFIYNSGTGIVNLRYTEFDDDTVFVEGWFMVDASGSIAGTGEALPAGTFPLPQGIIGQRTYALDDGFAFKNVDISIRWDGSMRAFGSFATGDVISVNMWYTIA